MTKTVKWINVFCFLAMVVINTLANLLPLGGKNTGEISAGYSSLFTPAPFTFSIWGVIYLLMAVFVLFQTGLFKNSTETGSMSNEIGWFFALSCLVNILWIFAWHFDRIGLSLVLIGILLLILIIMNGILDLMELRSPTGRLSLYGFQIYMGWLTAAVIANASVYLVKIKWTRFGLSESLWTILILIVGTVIGSAFVLDGFHLFATFSVVWAYFGILIKHTGADGYAGNYRSIILTVSICIAVMLIAIGMAAPSRIRTSIGFGYKP